MAGMAGMAGMAVMVDGGVEWLDGGGYCVLNMIIESQIKKAIPEQSCQHRQTHINEVYSIAF